VLPVELVEAEKLESLAREVGLDNWTTDLESALASTEYPVYFDAQITSLRADAVRAALQAGKHVYCEKPLAEDVNGALDLARLAAKLRIKSGVVQDKLFLPGLVKLRELIDSGFFGRILSVKGDFGYWVFEGHDREPQRPSWNYRREDGGGIILDMFPHWHYVLSGLFGRIDSLICTGATHIEKRVDENGQGYEATADDAAYATFRLADGVIAQMNSSWCTRVYRDELLMLQVDGTRGSAVAGLRGCKTQTAEQTAPASWNPDLPNPIDFRSGWTDVPDSLNYENGFKEQWTSFISHIVEDTPCCPRRTGRSNAMNSAANPSNRRRMAARFILALSMQPFMWCAIHCERRLRLPPQMWTGTQRSPTGRIYGRWGSALPRPWTLRNGEWGSPGRRRAN